MSDPNYDNEFDAIVVGAGLAGSSAALTMAREGMDVIVLERGSAPGTTTTGVGAPWSSGTGRSGGGSAGAGSGAWTPGVCGEGPSRPGSPRRTGGCGCPPAGPTPGSEARFSHWDALAGPVSGMWLGAEDRTGSAHRRGDLATEDRASRRVPGNHPGPPGSTLPAKRRYALCEASVRVLPPTGKIGYPPTGKAFPSLASHRWTSHEPVPDPRARPPHAREA